MLVSKLGPESRASFLCFSNGKPKSWKWMPSSFKTSELCWHLSPAPQKDNRRAPLSQQAVQTPIFSLHLLKAPNGLWSVVQLWLLSLRQEYLRFYKLLHPCTTVLSPCNCVRPIGVDGGTPVPKMGRWAVSWQGLVFVWTPHYAFHLKLRWKEKRKTLGRKWYLSEKALWGFVSCLPGLPWAECGMTTCLCWQLPPGRVKSTGHSQEALQLEVSGKYLLPLLLCVHYTNVPLGNKPKTFHLTLNHSLLTPAFLAEHFGWRGQKHGILQTQTPTSLTMKLHKCCS